MSKVAHYLQQHVSGEVTVAPDVRRYFSTDGSIFAVTPSVIVYPRSEQDIRKATRFTWQLAERGRVIPLTSRGYGTDQTGGSIGSGIMLVFPAHLNKILELDSKTGLVTVEPGINFGKLQQTLHTHGRFLPPYPAAQEYSSVGGSIANNTCGERSIKYGSTRDFTKSLRVVLANGEVIETKRLGKREVGKKLGLATFEGEIYRSLDALLEENKQLIASHKQKVNLNTAGYDIFSVKRKDGSIDLTPLFVGSEGTLGIITEAVLETAPHNPETALLVASIDDLKIAEEILGEIKKLPESPCSVEIIDENLLAFIERQNPNLLKGVLEPPFHKLLLFVEFDNLNDRLRKKLAKKTAKIFDRNQVTYQMEFSEEKKAPLRKLRDISSSALMHAEGGARPLPIINDGVVPHEKFSDFLARVYELLRKHQVRPMVWGHGIDTNLHIQPLLDLSQVGDRQKAFKIMDDYYSLVIEMGGTTAGEDGDGRLRAPYLSAVYGQELYTVFQKVKKIFDPHGTLNPGVKINVSREDIRPLVRSSYSVGHFHHLPRG